MEASLSRLQLLTADRANASHWQQAQAACRAGVRWVQMRSKQLQGAALIREAREVVRVCRDYNACCVINDFPEVAAEVAACGVHLGRADCSVLEARAILSTGSIIGGTANTLHDMLQLQEQAVSYIGLGPFRHTGTKKQLSPILGLDHICQMSKRWQQQKGAIPVYLIGGIVLDDVRVLLSSGFYGVAVCSAIVDANNPEQVARAFMKTITGEKYAAAQNC